MQDSTPPVTCFRVDDCRLSIAQLGKESVLIVLEGTDVGRFGREPFRELERRLDARRPVELFFDLRAARGATLDASGSWALWLRANRERLRRVSMLTARPVIGLSAKTVARFSQLGERAKLYSSPAEFERALAADA